MFSKIDRLFKVLVGISITIIILYEIAGIRNAVKRILLFMENNHILFGISYIKLFEIIILMRKLSIFCILLYLFYLTICWTAKKLLERKQHHNVEGYSPFESTLLKYLNDKNGKRTYLVTGEWGSGKTYIVSQFFDKFFKYSSRKVYRISCFGLETREQVLREIREKIELNDTSPLNMIQYIPLIGPLVYSFLKETFSLNNIKSNSIFIFDDFERITAIGLTASYYDSNKFYRNNLLYKTNPSLGRKINNSDLAKEFENIEKGMLKIQKLEEEKYFSENFQKYNVVTGLINELVDSYDLKVIIICNVDILGYSYLDLIFRGKLDCINYAKSVDFKTIKSVFDDIFNNQVFNNDENKKIVGDFFDLIAEDFKQVVEVYGRTNLRYVRTIIQSFVETINLLFVNNISCNNDYCISLFYSIFVSKILHDENDIGKLKNFETGGNLCFYVDLCFYSQENKLLQALSQSKFSSKMRWAGLAPSSFWIMNMSKPKNWNTQFEEFGNYIFSEEEYNLFINKTFKTNQLYLIEHILYLLRYFRRNNRDRNDTDILTKNIIDYIEHIDVDSLLMDSENLYSPDIVDTILNKIYTITGGAMYQEIFKEIYQKLYQKYKIQNVSEVTHIHGEYNRAIKVVLDSNKQNDHEINKNNSNN